jgi:hypothetical protein
MARRKKAGKTATQKSRRRGSPQAPARRPRHPSGRPTPHFVGRAGSPVLEKYPPKSMDAAVGEVAGAKAASPGLTPSPSPLAVPTSAASPAQGPAPTPAVSPPTGPPKALISLERPFDVDDFSQLLGQTQIQVTVPRDSLAEVLRRACDFMGFGIYVYSIRVRPGPEELLKTFIVELQRVDFSAPSKDWVPFQERGRADSPFGPTGTR